jgi:hypothetical protein
VRGLGKIHDMEADVGLGSLAAVVRAGAEPKPASLLGGEGMDVVFKEDVVERLLSQGAGGDMLSATHIIERKGMDAGELLAKLRALRPKKLSKYKAATAPKKVRPALGEVGRDIWSF